MKYSFVCCVTGQKYFGGGEGILNTNTLNCNIYLIL